MSKEIRIAAIAIISAFIFYYGFNFLKGSDLLSSTNCYYAVYNNVGNLAKSNPVKINGVTVGKVNHIQLLSNDGNRVLIEFDVEKEVVLGDSTVAELTSDFLGGNSIVLRIGNVTTEKKAGDTLISRVDKGLQEIIESAQPVANNMNLVLNRLNNLLSEFKGIGDQLKTTITTLDATLATMNHVMEENESEIGEIMQQSDLLLRNINARVTQLEPLINDAGNVLDSISPGAIANTLEELEGLMNNLNELTAGLKNGEGSLGKLLVNDSLYNNLNRVMVDLDKLLVHIDQYPKDFFKPLGRKHKNLKGAE